MHIYDINNRKGLSQLSQCDINPLHSLGSDSICGVRFAHTDANTLFVATISGKISLYDLRTDPSAKQTFECADIQLKPFTCFDLNVSDTTLCAGTEQSSSEAYLVFFDKRQNKMLNAYTDSHENDLTQVKFHPINHNVLASGSTDGLINVFDTTEPTEDDALVFCLNTESSIQKIDWHPKDTISEEPTNHLSCITDTNDFQWFDVEDSELMFQFDRSEIAKLTKRKAPSHCYLVDCHTDSNGETFLLVGSNYNRGECLRSLTLRKDTFVPRNSFSDNKQIIRCSSFNSKVTFSQIFTYSRFHHALSLFPAVVFHHFVGECAIYGWRRRNHIGLGTDE